MSDLHWFNLSTLTIKKDTIEKQYDYAYKMYIRSINEFFNYAPYKVIFPVESEVLVINISSLSRS